MTAPLPTGLAAGALTIGVLVGAAGAVLVHEGVETGMGGMGAGMTDMDRMHQIMSMTGNEAGMPMEVGPVQHKLHRPGRGR